MQLRIGPKVLVTMLAVAVPSLLLMFLITITIHGAILHRDIIRQLNGLSRLSVNAVEDMVQNSKDVLLALTEDPDLRELLRRLDNNGQGDIPTALTRVEKSFLGYQQLDKSIQAIRFIDPLGNVLFKVREGRIMPREGPMVAGLGLPAVGVQAQRDFFQHTAVLKQGEIWISHLERGWLEGEESWCPAMVRFATPVFHGNGALAGVLVINIWGESIGRMINRLIPPEEGYAFLVERNAREAERNGIYLFHPDRQCEFGNQTGSKINVFRDYSGEMTGSWMTQATSAFDHPVSRDILIHRFYSPYQTDQRGWIVVIHANRDVFLAPLARMKKIGALLAVLGLAATVGAALFFAQTLTRPLRQIIDGTQRLSQDLGSRISVTSRDEIGQLAEHINEMAATIENDLAEKRRAEDMICQSEKLASIGGMAAGIAHELNTPLSNIRALAVLTGKDLQHGSTTPEDLAADLEEIVGQIDKCSRIIGGLLSFARKQQRELSPCDINELLDQALTLVRLQAEEKKVRIDVVRNDALPRLMVDGHQIEQVCVNILLNAVDAVAPGGEILVRLEQNDGKLVLRFADNGHGIKPEYLSHVFDPFFTSKEVGKGTGLGLSVSYGIVRNHGGTIEVESREGEGAVFSVMLPVVREA